MTSGLPRLRDRQRPRSPTAAYADPFRAWTTDELLRYAVDEPLLYEPGTNWNYAHTNYVLLGLALEKATGQEMPELLTDNVSIRSASTSTAAFADPGDPRAGAARVQLRAPGGARSPRGHTVLRGVDVLEPVVDHHPRRHPDHHHL